MGYTHYWEHPEISETQWGQIEVRARKIINHAQDQLGIALSEEYDVNRIPVVTDNEIRFNGFGEEGHETFMMTREPTSFEFCKTARKPYDAVVVAILQCMSIHVDGFDWRSDGDPDEHADGIKLYNDATGAGWETSTVSRSG